MDTLSREKRSLLMSAVRSQDTNGELLLRRFLWSHGLRYHIHPNHLCGKPDIALSSCKLAIFVHGCYWHGHDNCIRGRLPKSNVKYWKAKIKANKIRDSLVEKTLKQIGWDILVVWECQLRTQKASSVTLPRVLAYVLSKYALTDK